MGVLVLFACIALISMLVFIIRIVNNIRDENLSAEERHKIIRNNVIGIFISGIIAVVFTFSAVS